MSRDAALALLFPLLRAQQAPALWVLDEHGAEGGFMAPNPRVHLLSNRVDVAASMAQAGWQTHFSDFDFSPWPAGSLDAIFLRLAKEKPVVHHIINAAAERLSPGGRLILAGGKQQGIKTYARNAAQRLGNGVTVDKMGGDYLALVHRAEATGTPLDDRDYPLLRPVVQKDGFTFFSKPGLYGWDKVDEGSAFLVAHLDECPEGRRARTVFDLGCGYGYLSVQAHRKLAPQRMVASDNNAAAVLACRRNFAAQGIDGEVVAADCAGGVEERFDLVLCNPPFHQGFGVERDLTGRFVVTARRLCAEGGMALFVTNSFIPIERIARPHFRGGKVLADNGRFKLTCLRP